METNREIDVTSLDAAHRQALEDVIGTPLQANERLIINVMAASAEQRTSPPRPAQTLEDWAKVYEGLSDDEIEDIDKIVNTRADLTRDLPQLMDDALLDTDILSEVLKRKDPRVLATAREYLAQHQRLAFSAITVYEVLRGMQAKGATRQLGEFLKTVATSDVLPISVPVLMRAADLWAEASRSGHSRTDADLIIAATALETRRVLVTGNTDHFVWISGLSLTDWRAAPESE